MSEHRFENKLCVVTGAGRGIGKAVAQRLLDEGAYVVAANRSLEPLQEWAKGYTNIDIVAANTATLAGIDVLAKAAQARSQSMGVPVFALLPVVGGGPDTRVSDASEEAFDTVLSQNLKSSFFTVQKVLPLMDQGSSVVLFASIAGHQGGFDSVVYNASKAAVRTFGLSFANELGPRGIRVNVISPGPTATEGFTDFIHGDDQRLHTIESMSPQGRVGSPEEVAAAAAFLASSQASYVNGAELIVDGGFLIS